MKKNDFTTRWMLAFTVMFLQSKEQEKDRKVKRREKLII